MTLNERAQHLNLAINFTILVITGFALSFPKAFWVSPITDVPAGMTLRDSSIDSAVWPRFAGGLSHFVLCLYEKGEGDY